MENLERTLAEHPFFKGMSAKHIALIAGCATNVSFKAGQLIFKEGEPANVFYFIRQGKVQVEVNVPNKGPLVIHTRSEGDIFGWSWLLPPYRWHFDAHAAEVTRALSIDGKCLRQKCEEDHDLGYELMKRFILIVTERLEATRLQLLDVYGDVSKK